MKAAELLTFSFSLDQLNCKEEDILFVMGYSDFHESPVEKHAITAIFAELEPITTISGGCNIYHDPVLDTLSYTLTVNDQSFELGKLIASRLKYLEQLAIFACTAGPAVSELSKRKLECGDLVGSYIVDSVGSVIVENAMDNIQELLRTKMSAGGYQITNRYSPGYCHWPTSEQKKIFNLLPVAFCGITLTESSLMVPVKSISGIIGIGKGVKHQLHQCSVCSLADCYLRKEAYSPDLEN